MFEGQRHRRIEVGEGMIDYQTLEAFKGNHKYRLTHKSFLRHGSPSYSWAVVGRHGAVHLHLTRSSFQKDVCEDDRWHGGVEYHWRNPPSYMDDRPPSHANCEILNSNCWHDGSSTYAREGYLAHVLAGRHEYIFHSLIRDYERQIHPGEDHDT